MEARMDLIKVIAELRREKAKLDSAIASLEGLSGQAEGAAPAKSRRGRKFMTDAEKQQVSDRMKRYWANRRKT